MWRSPERWWSAISGGSWSRYCSLLILSAFFLCEVSAFSCRFALSCASKPLPDVDQVGVVDRGAHARADVPVPDQAALEQHHVHDLADQRAREGGQVQPPDPILDLARDRPRSLLVRALAVVEGLDQPGLDQDLPDDPLAVPLEDMPVRPPDGRHGRDPDPVEGRLAARLRGGHGITSLSRRASTAARFTAPPAKSSADVRNVSPFLQHRRLAREDAVDPELGQRGRGGHVLLGVRDPALVQIRLQQLAVRAELEPVHDHSLHLSTTTVARVTCWTLTIFSVMV